MKTNAQRIAYALVGFMFLTASIMHPTEPEFYALVAGFCLAMAVSRGDA